VVSRNGLLKIWILLKKYIIIEAISRNSKAKIGNAG